MLGSSRVLNVILSIPAACRRAASCIKGSPLVFVLIVLAVVIIVSAVLVFNICLVKIFTAYGALTLNLCFLWCLLRLIVRALVFPGSIVLWKRNTEASYRVEMSKQFAHHLEQLHLYLLQATRKSPKSLSVTATLDGVMLGCMVIEGLARNFRVQQRDQVKFSAEQARVKLLITGVESWISEAKVCEQRRLNGGATPFLEWLQRVSHSMVPQPLSFALASTPLDASSESEASACIERLEQLIHIFVELQSPIDNFCSNARRFLRCPTVGSLHQLRAELLVRYSGHHHWVRTASGRKIDGMLISCKAAGQGAANLGADDGSPGDHSTPGSSREDVPLKSMDDGAFGFGPVIIWCNPNAAYYETMAYESHWLDFYLAQGCSVFVFNYSGFGRSQGNPTPKALAEDGNAVVEFLKRRGCTSVGVHGRSIGGIAACAIAGNHPDVIKLLVADRTFSTLDNAARFTFGAWAVKGLGIAATKADNFSHFAKARCYKVMICDPKDATIPELAALRSAVAINAIDQVPSCDRIVMEGDKVQKLAEAWTFLEMLVSVCDRDDACDARQCTSCRGSACSADAKKSARQIVVGKSITDSDVRIEVEDDDNRGLVSRKWEAGTKCTVNRSWLEEHTEMARAQMGSYADIIRLALDMVGTTFNASGMTFEDVFSRAYDDPKFAMRCFLANIQVWGSLGSLREPLWLGVDRDIELLLHKGVENQDSADVSARLAKLAMTLTPDKLAAYHRHISRTSIAQIRREFRVHLAHARRVMEPALDASNPHAPLFSVVLSHLREIESFLTTIYRFFKCIDIAENNVPAADGVNSSDDSEEGKERSTQRPNRPNLDRSVVGYVMTIECGHNGVLNEGEVQHLALHLKAAKFGKYDTVSDGSLNV